MTKNTNSAEYTDTHVLAASKFAKDILRFYDLVDAIHLTAFDSVNDSEFQELMARQRRMANNYLAMMNGDYS